MPIARFTQAEVTRAIKAARDTGCEAVEVREGVIRILVKAPPADLASDELAEAAWEERMAKWS